MKEIIANQLTNLKTTISNTYSTSNNNLTNFNQVNSDQNFNHHLEKAENDYNSINNKKSKISNNKNDENKLPNSNLIQEKNELKDDTNSINSKDDITNKTIEKKIESASKEINNRINTDKTDKTDKNDKLNEKSGWESLVNLLQKVMDLTKQSGDKTSKNEPWKKSLQAFNTIKDFSHKLSSKSNNELIKDLGSIFNDLREYINTFSKEDGKSLVKKIKTNDKNALLEEILSDLQVLFNKKIEEDGNKKSLLSSSKIEKIAEKSSVQQGIQIINKKNESKAEINKTNVEIQSISQKNVGENTVMLESNNDSNANLDNSQERITNNFGLKLPKGSNIKNPKELFDQIVNKATLISNARRSEMEIKLEPRIMGNVSIKITLEGGIVSGRFLVDNPIVKAFLEENIGLLKDNLEAQGLDFNEINISLGDNKQNQFSDKEAQLSQIINEQSIFNSTIYSDEDDFVQRYVSPDWLAKEVDLVV